jgi:hypothetical protein
MTPTRKQHWMVNIGIRVSRETREELAARAENAGMNLSAYVNHVLVGHLVRLKKNPKLSVDS